MTVVNIILLSLCLPAIILAQQKEVSFKACNGTEILKFTVTPCDVEPCKIARGSTVKIEIDFIANQDTNKVRHNVKAVLANGIPTGTFPGLRLDACKANNIPCPVRNGETQHYSTDLNIMQFYPQVSANATFLLTGSEGVVLMCATAEVTVI